MLLFPSRADHEALELTAVVVFGMHLVAFAVARRGQGAQRVGGVAGWEA